MLCIRTFKKSPTSGNFWNQCLQMVPDVGDPLRYFWRIIRWYIFIYDCQWDKQVRQNDLRGTVDRNNHIRISYTLNFFTLFFFIKTDQYKEKQITSFCELSRKMFRLEWIKEFKNASKYTLPLDEKLQHFWSNIY